MPMQLCAAVCLNPWGWALIVLVFLTVAAFSDRAGWLLLGAWFILSLIDYQRGGLWLAYGLIPFLTFFMVVVDRFRR
jgi:hypothetical protein